MTDFQTPPSAPMAATPELQQKRGNGFGLTSLILGIVAMVGFAIPFFNYVTIVLAAVGLVLGIVGLVVKYRPRKAAVAGVILSALGLILSIILVVVYAAIFSGVSKAVDDQKAAAAKTHTVVYTVSGDSTDAIISYSTYTDGSSGTEQASNQKLPFTKQFTVKGSSKSFSVNSFDVTATNGQTGTKVTCEIKVDGKVISTKSSTGQYASVSCDGTN